MSFADPVNNVDQLELSSPMVVADFGAGSGSYVLAVAPRVMPDGKVYAIDIQKDLLERIKILADKRQVGNVEVVWGDVERVGGCGLADNSVDVVILSNALFQMQSLYTLSKEVKRVLRRGGQVLVVEWSESFGGLGPKAGQVVAQEQAEKIFTEDGFQIKRKFPAGDHHYGFILIKN